MNPAGAIEPTSYESRAVLLTLSASIPPTLIVFALMWQTETSVYLQALTMIFLVALTLNAVIRNWQRSAYQSRSLTNLLGAMIAGDYSMRGRNLSNNGPFQELVSVINQLSVTLSKLQMASEENRLLLHKVVEHIDVAIITFDEGNRIALINPAAQTLLNQVRAGELLPAALSFAAGMQVGESRLIDENDIGKRGRYRVHLEQYRQDGSRHSLLFISDVLGMLRAEERRVWQNLVRVLSHELNNSLAPIVSISGTLQSQIHKLKEPLAEDIKGGLKVIEDRAFSLKQFVQSYRQLAQLPEPSKKTTELSGLIDIVAGLFPAKSVTVTTGAPLSLLIDADQIKQVFVNLLKNGQEAVDDQAQKTAITIHWETEPHKVLIYVKDDGQGIQNRSNLFVPFYTTKQHGSGIGLVLSRQIIEAHSGYLTLENREDSPGCVATVELPR